MSFVRRKPNQVAALTDGGVVRYGPRQPHHVHRAYEEKRRRIQKLSGRKPRAAGRLMRKYSRREKDRPGISCIS